MDEIDKKEENDKKSLTLPERGELEKRLKMYKEEEKRIKNIKKRWKKQKQIKYH